MTKFDKLTVGEHKRLVALEAQVDLASQVMNDDVFWSYSRVLGDNHIYAIEQNQINSLLAAQGKPDLQGVEVDKIQVKRWAEAGYISILPNAINPFDKFILTPRGSDYLDYCSKSRFVRWFIDLWSDLRPEVVSAIVSLIVALITAYLVVRLGLK